MTWSLPRTTCVLPAAALYMLLLPLLLLLAHGGCFALTCDT
jgi:hypothetical protein